MNVATERLSHGRTAVGVKLLAGNHQSYDVDAGCDPAVVRILTVGTIGRCVKVGRSWIMSLQRKILNQGHTVDVVEHTHQQQLDDSPHGDDQSAQGQFWSTEGHGCDADRKLVRWENPKNSAKLAKVLQN